MRIAQRFIAGYQLRRRRFSPGGTVEVVSRCDFNRPAGTAVDLATLNPSDKSLGYARMSLRDRLLSSDKPSGDGTVSFNLIHRPPALVERCLTTTAAPWPPSSHHRRAMQSRNVVGRGRRVAALHNLAVGRAQRIMAHHAVNHVTLAAVLHDLLARHVVCSRFRASPSRTIWKGESGA